MDTPQLYGELVAVAALRRMKQERRRQAAREAMKIS
jgi:hypothetical protein